MGGRIHDQVRGFLNNRWLVFVAAMWLQSVAGVGYLFGSISPVIKSSLSYNQRQISRLGVAKDLGDAVGFFAGSLCEYLPLWAALFIGALKNFVGYGWIWLIVTGRLPALPLWAMCVLVFVGTNGETYFNTASLVSCVQNFPKSRGPVVGILKGFAGLSGAILTQIYAVINAPDRASIIFMVAVAPSMVAIALMFFVRPVGGHRQVRPSDARNFTHVYTMCLLLAAYLMGVMLVLDLVSVAHAVVTIFTAVLFLILLAPILIPISLSFSGPDARGPEEEALLGGPGKSGPDPHEVILSEVESEVEDERSKGADSLNASERQKRIAQLQTKLLQAAAEGAVRVKRRRGPHRGEDFTLMQALIKADFWLLFTALVVGSGSGLTVIDNLGQISQSLRYENPHIFVSLISIWNFLGRVGGGYLSEIVVSKYAYPRPVALAVAQLIMALGHVYVGLALPGALYVGTVIIGLCYGAHWAIVPATASELFGVRSFGALYNFITVANPAGTLLFSSLIASSIYDREAEKQARQHNHAWSHGGSFLSGFLGDEEPPKCDGAVCFSLTLMIMAGFCLLGIGICMTLVYRTKSVYAQLYGNSRTRGAS